MPDTRRPLRILAVASSGGHWDELLAITASFTGHDVTCMTTRADQAPGGAPIVQVADFSRHAPLKVLTGGVGIAAAVWRLRPDVVISTGAAPGFVALVAAKLIGRRTLWLDSIANAERLSLSGRMAAWFADLCLSQYPHLATGRVRYFGAVL